MPKIDVTEVLLDIDVNLSSKDDWVSDGKSKRITTSDNFSGSVTPNDHFGRDAWEIWVRYGNSPIFSCAVHSEKKAKLVVDHVIDSSRWRLRPGQ